jgi:hypothetical protein
MTSKRRSRPITIGQNTNRPPNISRAAMADEVLFEPWFLPPKVAFAILSIVPPAFRSKMRYFFDDYGCMICHKGVKHHSNGMCRPCRQKIQMKLIKSVKRRLKNKLNERLDLELFRQEKLAKTLLGRFSPARDNACKRRIDLQRSHNPVYEALCARRN